MNPKMCPTEYVTVSSQESGVRLDRFLCARFRYKTRSYFTKLIKSQHVIVNGVAAKAGLILQTGDEIVLRFIEEKTDLSPAEDIPLDIVFEDDALIVVNKPVGLTVHPGKGTGGNTLVNALLHHTSTLSEKGGIERPGIVHRLDKNTSGLLVVAKNDHIHQLLQKQFETKTIEREYTALVWGTMKKQQGSIETYIERSRRDPTKMVATKQRGRAAITHYKVEKEFIYMTLLSLALETGRTHQIRVHMNYINHPVVGDPDYNGRKSQLSRLPVNLQKRGMHLLDMLPHQFLHARKLQFIHPGSREKVVFEAGLPQVLNSVLDKINQMFLVGIQG